MTFTDRDRTVPFAGSETSGRHGWDRHPGVRTGRRLRTGERAADLVCRVVGSWTYLIVVAAVVPAGAAAAWALDRHVDGWVFLAAGLSALALVQMSLVLVAARRADRIASELALYRLDQSRRAAAIAEDVRDDLARLHDEIARLAAQAAVTSRTARHG